jgi:APA family basic amino acid/polyamine antiporter
MLNYIITIAISAFFVPHYLSIFWGPLRENPWDIVGGVGGRRRAWCCSTSSGIQEAGAAEHLPRRDRLRTQLLLVIVGFALIFDPHSVFSANIHWGVAPTWQNFFLAIPIAMIAYTGIETVSNLAEEARDPPRDIPRSISWVAIAVFAIYFTLPLIALSALPVQKTDGGTRRCSGCRRTGRLRERPGARPRREPRPARRVLTPRRSTSASSPRRSSSSPRTPA